MSGSASRKRGHDWERLLARELSDLLDLDIRTTRALGANYGADLATVTAYDAHGRPVLSEPAVCGWSIEAKDDVSRNIRGWLTQADDQKAPGLRPVVLWKWRNHSWLDGSAFVWDENAPRGWWEMPVRTWVEGLVAKDTVSA